MHILVDVSPLPQELIRAQQDGKLVIFAGAGVSMGPPSNYPSFIKLAENIAEGTSLQGEDLKNTPLDRFLGRLSKLHQVNVHDKAKRLLTNPNSQPTPLHKDLLRLFQSSQSIRIVTTNFDNHFTTAFSWLYNEIKPSTFMAPALPLGDNFQGIVYLHGSVEQESHNLILTDEDFGRAYLTKGWARRFLLDLFNHYHVLFVGYSHEDTIVSYLARALPPARFNKRFAIIANDDDKSRWEHLGIHTITYPKIATLEDPYERLGQFFNSWGELIELNIFQHHQRIKNIINKVSPPDLLEENYLKHIVFKQLATLNVFLEQAKTEKWLIWVNEQRLLDSIFKKEIMDNPLEKALIRWFIQCINTEPLASIEVLIENGGILNEILWLSIAHNFHVNFPSMEIYAKWLVVLLQSPHAQKDRDFLTYHLQNCNNLDFLPIILLLFTYLTRPHLKLKQSLRFYKTDIDQSSHYTTVEIEIVGDKYFLNQYKNTVIIPNIELFAEPLLNLLEMHVREAYYFQQNWNNPLNPSYSLSFSRAAIEEHSQNSEHNDFKIIIDLLRDCLQHIIKQNPDQALQIINTWARSGIPILERIAIHGLGEASFLCANNKMQWLLDRDWVYHLSAKHEVRKLIKKEFSGASENIQNELVLQIQKGAGDE